MIEFLLPSLGSDMDEGTLVEWRVRPGDTVHRGQVVAVVDTTKAAIDVECWDEGVVHALLAEPGHKLPVGAPLALLRSVGESASDVDRQWAAVAAARQTAAAETARPVSLSVPAAPAIAAAPRATPAQPGPVPGAAPRRVSPAARRLAMERGIDLATIAARSDVISLEDVLAVAEVKAPGPVAAPSAPSSRSAPPPLSPPPSSAAASSAATRALAMRQTIAAAMSRSKREIPHYYLAEEVEFERAAAWLAARNAGLPAAQRLLPAALLLKAVAFALRRYPEFSGFWRDGAFVPGAGMHIGVAVSLREGGLVAPALHDVDRQDIAALTRALLDLVKRARAGALRSSEFSDPTITVTNLGDQGVGSVFGVIYPPQVALVGFGRISARPLAAEEGGGVRVAPMLTATLAADHRASDGHRGALLLAEIRQWVQDPDALDRPWTPITPMPVSKP